MFGVKEIGGDKNAVASETMLTSWFELQPPEPYGLNADDL